MHERMFPWGKKQVSQFKAGLTQFCFKITQEIQEVGDEDGDGGDDGC